MDVTARWIQSKRVQNTQTRETPSPYSSLGKSFQSSPGIRLTLLGAIEKIGALVTRLGCKLSVLEKDDQYIMSHLGELDDRFDDLRSEYNKITDTIQRLQGEIYRLREGNGETIRIKKAPKRVPNQRKRVRKI